MSLTDALLKVQNEIDKVERDGKNSHTQAGYPTLEGILDVLNPHLNANEIVVNQMPFNIGGIWVLRTTVKHKAESESFDIPLLGLEGAKNQMQAFGAAITYARRYGLISYFKLAATKMDERQMQAVNQTAMNVNQVKEAFKKENEKKTEAKVHKDFGDEKDFTKELAKDRAYFGEDKLTKPIKNFAPQTTAGYKFTFGQFTGKTIQEVGETAAKKYLDYLIDTAAKSGKPLSPSAEKFQQEFNKFVESKNAP